MVLSGQAGILILDKQAKQNIEQNKSDQQSLKDIISSRENGFGLILKQCRERKNLSLDDIAKKLHLDTKIIQALDNEDYTQLPAPAFVCGYIRNYAKYLGLQPEALIADYKKHSGSEAIEPELKVSKQKKITNSSLQGTFFILLFKLLLLGALVAGSWYLWLYISDNFINNVRQTENAIELTDELTIKPLSNGVEDDDPETLLLPAIDNESLNENIIQSNESLATIKTSDVLDNETSQPALEDVNEPVIELAGSAIETEGILPNGELINDSTNTLSAENIDNKMVQEAEAMEINDNPIADNQLILEFSADSWIKIKDATKKTISSGTKKSGTVLNLTGQRPYDMTVGNANKVKISIDGQVFDHSSFINENSIARFTLP